MKTVVLHFMFGTQRLWTIFCFCLQILPEWIEIGHWFIGGTGDPNLPLPCFKFPPPQTFSLASFLESRFSSCSLRNIEYCCVISPHYPPQFPTLFRAPTSRPFFSLLSYPSHPLFARAPTPWPIWLEKSLTGLITIAVYHLSFILSLLVRNWSYFINKRHLGFN